jgi:hypothetical protein
MKKSRFSEEQIIGVLKQHEGIRKCWQAAPTTASGPTYAITPSNKSAATPISQRSRGLMLPSCPIA